MKEYTEESINQLVDRIVDDQMAEGHFANCPITFRDIQSVKAVFKEKLRTIYHTRISYPQLNASAETERPTEANRPEETETFSPDWSSKKQGKEPPA